MKLTPLQKATCQGIVNVFETGTPRGDYANVTLLKGDRGGLTYGKAQTTINSGNLYLLVRDYCDAPNSRLGGALRKYLPGLKAKSSALNRELQLTQLLAQAGADPVMQQVQDTFFDRVYWEPALEWAERYGFTCALSMAVIYDSFIHSGTVPMYLRTRFEAAVPSAKGDEVEWISAYLDTRKDWLAGHSIRILRKTVYRINSLQQMVEQDNWALDLPLTVRGKLITAEVLGV